MHLEIYKKLREHLHEHPMGLPETPSGAELDILNKLFTAEEAEVALNLTPRPQTADELAEKLGADRGQLASLLQRMADKGLILELHRKEELRYVLVPFVPGIYEFQVKSMDEELARAFETIYPHLGREIGSAQTPWMRVLPAEESFPAGMEVMPHERASQVIAQAERVALTDCICRKEQKLIGRGCHKPLDEICFYLPPWADFAIDKGIAREATKAEALAALQRAENAGLVHLGVNVLEHVSGMCQCCSCCCAVLRGVSELKLPNAVAKSDFFSIVDAERCTGCEACVAICPPQALRMEDEKAVADSSTCIGCGLCVLECPTDAIALKEKAQEERRIPPASFRELMQAIARDKGRSYFY